MKKNKFALSAIFIAATLAACSGSTPEGEVHTTKTTEKNPAAVSTSNTEATVESFDEQAPPPAPDYSQDTSWASLPAKPGASLSKPLNSPPANKSAKDVNVFYIHPTTYKTQTQWNQDIRDAETNKWTNESVVARQASAFNECCEIYAPYYRQASFLATKDRLMVGDGGKAYDLAYSDVLRAFDEFIETHNNDRPFILVGHSQGAEHSYRLLRDRIDSTPLKQEMVAAYVVGLDLMEGAFGREFKQLAPCEKPEQFGCVMGWNAVNKDADLAFYKKFAGQRYANKFGTDEGRKAVCTNPLTFDMSETSASKEAGLGAVQGEPGFGPLGTLIPNAVNASCDSGFLVTEYAPILDLEPLPGGSLHYHDFSLFYQNIKVNAAQRIAAYKSSN